MLAVPEYPVVSKKFRWTFGNELFQNSACNTKKTNRPVIAMTMPRQPSPTICKRREAQNRVAEGAEKTESRKEGRKEEGKEEKQGRHKRRHANVQKIEIFWAKSKQESDFFSFLLAKP